MVFDGKKNDVFGVIPQQPPHVFASNPLIAKIATDESWSVSDKNKVPVNFRRLQETGSVINAKLNENPFVTLHTIDKDPNFDMVNRMYRLSALENRVMMIDIEPKEDDNVLLWWSRFPAHYAETSKNGGLHLLLQVPEEFITDENSYIFDTLVQIKENNRGTSEYLFNRHNITFTKKMFNKPQPDFRKGTNDGNWLEWLLDHLVEIDKEAKEKRLQIETAPDFDEDNLNINYINQQLSKPENAPMRGYMFHDVIMTKQFTDNLLDPSQKPDHSAREYSNLLKIHRQLIKTANSLIKQDEAMNSDYYETSDHSREMTANDFIYLAYLFAKELIPYRDKHEEYRHGLPWLLYQSQQAYYYIKYKDQEKESPEYAHFYSIETH